MDYTKNLKPYLTNGKSEQISKYNENKTKHHVYFKLSKLSIDDLIRLLSYKNADLPANQQMNLEEFIEDIVTNFIYSQSQEKEQNTRFDKYTGC